MPTPSTIALQDDALMSCDSENCPVAVHLNDVTRRLGKIETAVEKISSRMEAASGLIAALKWMAIIAAGVGALWAAIKSGGSVHG